MTFHLTVLTNDQARLIVSKTSTTDEALFKVMKAHYAKDPSVVVSVWSEY